MSGPIVWVTRNDATGIALVTGKGHDALVHEVAPDAKWSRGGKGWVLTLQQVADLACLCDVEHVIYRERVKP